MAKTPIQSTGFTSQTPLNYLLDAGAVYANLEYATEGGWTGELLGATTGGNSLSITNEYREIEVDGTFSRYKGQKVLMSANASLTTNVKEFTAENVRKAINGVIRQPESNEAPTDYQVVEGKSKLEDEDYLENIAYVGRISGTDEPIIVILDNALCTSGLESSFADDGEAVIPMTFEAHADADQVADRSLPARIFFPTVPPAA